MKFGNQEQARLRINSDEILDEKRSFAMSSESK
jgi:hypothetical protein